MRIVHLLFVALLLFPSVSRSAEAPVLALYGLDARKPPLCGKKPAEIAAWLVAHRFNAVFGGYKSRRLVAALRRRGIKVYAEIPLFVGARHWKRHPKSRPITAEGKPLLRAGWYAGVCPNQPWLREAKLKQIRRTVRVHRVDGIWLDFIRYPLRWERRPPALVQTCFCEVCLDLLQRETKIRIPGSVTGAARRARWILRHHRKRFVAWKTDRITAFVREARRVAREENPKVVIGLFGVPWRAEDHGGAITAILGQDYRKLGPHVDMLSPMAYHRMQGRGAAWIAGITRHLHQLTQRPVLPVVQACSVPDRLDDAEFSAAVRQALAAPSSGVIVFSQRHFARERRAKAWLKGTKRR